jgi:ribosomal-protein-alanine N-acetyltransferase
MTINNIETERFILRKVEYSDLEEIFNILSDENVITNLNMDLHRNIDDTRKLLDNYFEEYNKGTKYPYAIIEKTTKKLVGVFLIKLDLYDEDCFEFTIYIDPRFWNKGIYTEVLPYMTKVAIEDIKTGNFRGFVMEKNEASAIVLERAGFELEKIFNVPGLEGKIKSYLITRENYYKRNGK